MLKKYLKKKRCRLTDPTWEVRPPVKQSGFFFLLLLFFVALFAAFFIIIIIIIDKFKNEKKRKEKHAHTLHIYQVWMYRYYWKHNWFWSHTQFPIEMFLLDVHENHIFLGI